MSVEQTSQLLQLVLNSVLMLTVCVVLWGVLIVRHTAVHNRLRGLNQEYFELLNHAVMLRGDRLQQIRGQLQQFRQRYQITHLGLLTLYAALLLLGLSTLVLALRSLLNWEWLIVGSLLLFTVGIAAMLAGTALALLDFWRSRHSVLEEMSWVLDLGEGVGETKPQKALPAKTLPKTPTRSGRPTVPVGGSPRKTQVKPGELVSSAQRYTS